jgi:hypothetical protein
MIYVKVSNGAVHEQKKVVKDWRRADWEKMRKDIRLSGEESYEV